MSGNRTSGVLELHTSGLRVIRQVKRPRENRPQIKIREDWCDTIHDMFENIEPEPRGFAGRPLLSLVFAVVVGSTASQVSSWFHLNDFVMSVMGVVAVVAIAYAWERLQTPRS